MAALDRDIVERITGERPDMTVVARVDGPAQAGRVLVTTGADVLLLSATGSGPLSGYLELMWSHPRLGVVVVDPRDGHGVFREFRCLQRSDGTRAWSQNLVEAIRSAARKLNAD